MKKKVLLIILVIITLLVTGCSSKEKKELTDAEKFKQEYESINNKKNKKSGKKNRTITISKDNPFIYSNAEEIVDKINKKKSFIVYFGFNDCPWCRSILEELIQAAKDKDVSTIYYVDISDIRDEKEVDDNGNINTTKEGSEAYNQLLEQLDSLLEEYTITKGDEKISTGEKRIYAPNLVAVSNGKALQLETGIRDDFKDPYAKLTKKDKKYAYNKFSCLFKCFEEESTVCQKNSC